MANILIGLRCHQKNTRLSSVCDLAGVIHTTPKHTSRRRGGKGSRDGEKSKNNYDKLGERVRKEKEIVIDVQVTEIGRVQGRERVTGERQSMRAKRRARRD